MDNGIKKEFSLKEIKNIAKEVLACAAGARKHHATIIALSGDLGAGKTTLAQNIASELGVKDNIISPTFVIMKIYTLKNKYYKKLVHIDAYRLEKDSELLNLGWEEIISKPENLVLIEWPEKVEKLIPKNVIRVSLSHKNEEIRAIDISS